MHGHSHFISARSQCADIFVQLDWLVRIAQAACMSDPSMTDASSIAFHGWPRLRSAASWQVIHEGLHGTAASRFKLIYSSQSRQVPKVPTSIRRSAACTSRSEERRVGKEW